LAFVLFFVAILGYLDYITGFEVTFSFFYLIPIAIATWYLDENSGYFITFLSLATWSISNWAAGETYKYEIIRVWNIFIRLVVFVFIIRLLEEFKRALNHEHLLAQTDHLTGIPNSREFYFQANAEILRACRFKQPITIAYLDVDYFKQINDHFGHSKGDAILRNVAQSILTTIRQTDTVARLGGDEFAILLPNTDQGGARFIMDKVQKKLAERMEKTNPKATFSIGVFTFDAPPASRVAKVVGLQNPLCEQDNLENAAYKVVCC
jgi:diguanylate cyclase (GGDEF)-like protein